MNKNNNIAMKILYIAIFCNIYHILRTLCHFSFLHVIPLLFMLYFNFCFSFLETLLILIKKQGNKTYNIKTWPD